MELLSSWELYWLLKLDAIGMLFTIVATFFWVPAIATTVIWAEESDVSGWVPFNICIIWILSVLLAVLIPSTKQMATIMVLPPIINSEKVQSIPPKLLDVLDLSLESVKDILQDKKD